MCPLSGSAVQPYAQQQLQQEERGLLVILMLVVALLLLGFAVGWRLRGKFDEVTLKKVNTREVQVQTPVKYTWWTQTPRFQPLSDREHGAFIW